MRKRTGQHVDHQEKAVPAIRDAAGAHSARSVVIAPGTVRMEFVMREHLAGVDHASIPAQVELTGVRLGRCENGTPWTLRIAGRHTLTPGCSRPRKRPAVRALPPALRPPSTTGRV